MSASPEVRRPEPAGSAARPTAELAPEPAVACAQVVVGALLADGVREAVLAPGSRSAPLAYVLEAADRAGLLRLHVRIDERTAGFLALGLAKASGRPVPVVTTSGTAAANLYPAVLEAAAADVPLIAITADRPAALRHSGANQTTDQLQLFGPHVRGFSAMDDFCRSPEAWQTEVRRLIFAAIGIRTRHPGPVQLNVSLTDPLLPSGPVLPMIPDAAPVAAARSAAALQLPAGPRTVVVAGDARPEVGAAIAAQCARARIPLLAEPSSGARRTPAALATARLLLGSSLAREIRRVVVVGRPTLSRSVSTLLARPDVELIVVSDVADWADPGLRRPTVVDAIRLEPDDRYDRAASDWLDRWRAADERLASGLVGLLRRSSVLTGPEVARTVLGAAPPDGPLVLGSSNPIRDADLVPVRDDLGPVYANRGLAGIDGTVSTAVGVALATGRPTHGLVGDVTFLHDLTGLVIGPEEPRPDLRIVVANDDGGSIFATLEHGRSEHAGSYERIFGTPHHADLAALARSLGLSVRTVHSAEELAAAVGTRPDGIEIVEAVTDRTGRRALDEAITALAATI